MLAAMQHFVMRLPAGMLHPPPPLAILPVSKPAVAGHMLRLHGACCLTARPRSWTLEHAGLELDARSRVEGAELAGLCIIWQCMASYGACMAPCSCGPACLLTSSPSGPVHALPVNCLYTVRTQHEHPACLCLLGLSHLCPHGVPLCACIVRVMPSCLIALTTIAAPCVSRPQIAGR